MLVCKKIVEKAFGQMTAKEAYKKVFVWIAKNIMPQLGEDELIFSIKRNKSTSLPSFTLKIYCGADLENVHEAQCEICKDTHRLSYMNKNYDCNRCNVNAFCRRIDAQMAVKQDYWKGKIKDEKS